MVGSAAEGLGVGEPRWELRQVARGPTERETFGPYLRRGTEGSCGVSVRGASRWKGTQWASAQILGWGTSDIWGSRVGWGLPRWLGGKEPACQWRRRGFHPWAGKSPWRRKWPPTPVFLTGESPRTEEPGGLQSAGSRRVRHDWATEQQNGVGQGVLVDVLREAPGQCFAAFMRTWALTLSDKSPVGTPPLKMKEVETGRKQEQLGNITVSGILRFSEN